MPRINFLKPKIVYEEAAQAAFHAGMDSSASSANVDMGAGAGIPSYIDEMSEKAPVEGFTHSEIFLQVLAKLSVLFLLPCFLFFYEKRSSTEMERNLQHFTGLKSTLEASISSEDVSFLEEIKEASIQRENLQKQIAWIEKIYKKRFMEVKILELVQNSIPRQSWLTEVYMEENRTLLKGATVQDADIHEFINNLLSSVLFTNVQLIRAEKQIGSSKVARKGFEIQCDMENRL